eukprot:CAMPEP_0194693244 /NCGR_PEP_ID=MMETSP0295-20121207/20389_1 /TAXON_ID=39354 /ORGANISM="Heterosigma akashiwo, Strain CCMP2393" /LENGTH=117 /DNA_ID=CAMNT_0039584035 /DNA_START=160 /DNA_END=509 /DNA_ORIENTATION=+
MAEDNNNDLMGVWRNLHPKDMGLGTEEGRTRSPQRRKQGAEWADSLRKIKRQVQIAQADVRGAINTRSDLREDFADFLDEERKQKENEEREQMLANKHVSGCQRGLLEVRAALAALA